MNLYAVDPGHAAAVTAVTMLGLAVLAVIAHGAWTLVKSVRAQRPAPRRHVLPAFPPSRLARLNRGELPYRDFLRAASAPPFDQDAPIPPPRHSMEDTPTGLFAAVR